MFISPMNQKMVSISSSVEGGSLEGYVVNSSEENIRNYLESQGANEELISGLLQKYSRIGLIRNMYVDEEVRGQGIGGDLVSDAINDAFSEGAEVVILVADLDDTENTYDLSKWYEENFDMVVIGSAGSNPVLMLDQESD
jgi:predicted GNAT family acetyltransferase